MSFTFCYDESLKLSLFCRSLKDRGFNGMRSHEPEYQHRPRLAYPMGTILSLHVYLRILNIAREAVSTAKSEAQEKKYPIRVVKYDGVSPRKIDSQTAGPRAEQE